MCCSNSPVHSTLGSEVNMSSEEDRLLNDILVFREVYRTIDNEWKPPAEDKLHKR